MTKEVPTRKKWTKPEIKRLGKIQDFAGGETPVDQGAGNTKS